MIKISPLQNFQFSKKKKEKKRNKHNAELQRADPGTKIMVYFCTSGRIFQRDAENGFSLFSSF